MLLAKVVGTVVATRKDPRLEGRKLLIIQPVDAAGKAQGGYVVSIDTVSAGVGELVVVAVSSARISAKGLQPMPSDSFHRRHCGDEVSGGGLVDACLFC
ncbi:MAG: EutN/CcmL family microcompartment protein [Bryobacterales bacterium]|nr:EutN/CcmL family microcompartment protein [Bryobacterales bacterium]